MPGIFAIAALCLGIIAAVPAVAADYTPWQEPDAARPSLSDIRPVKNDDACCKHCTKGQPCGNTCISAKAKCKSPPGCAC